MGRCRNQLFPRVATRRAPRTIATARGAGLLGPNEIGDSVSETRGERQKALPAPRRPEGAVHPAANGTAPTVAASHVPFLVRRANTRQRTCPLRMAKCGSRTGHSDG